MEERKGGQCTHTCAKVTVQVAYGVANMTNITQAFALTFPSQRNPFNYCCISSHLY